MSDGKAAEAAKPKPTLRPSLAPSLALQTSSSRSASGNRSTPSASTHAEPTPAQPKPKPSLAPQQPKQDEDKPDSETHNENNVVDNNSPVEEEDLLDVTDLDPSSYQIKHPLQHAWTMWYNAPPAKKIEATEWQENVKKVVTFRTVEDFWCFYNNLVQPTRLRPLSNYRLFKDGIMPAWEDKENEKGGKWSVELGRTETDMLNKAWLLTLLAMIGEVFEDPNEICGVVVSLRTKKNRLALWTKSGKNSDLQKRIGRQWRQITEIPTKMPMSYSLHVDPSAGRGNRYSSRPLDA